MRVKPAEMPRIMAGGPLIRQQQDTLGNLRAKDTMLGERPSPHATIAASRRSIPATVLHD
jgi:hypothetical protein